MDRMEGIFQFIGLLTVVCFGAGAIAGIVLALDSWAVRRKTGQLELAYRRKRNERDALVFDKIREALAELDGEDTGSEP